MCVLKYVLVNPLFAWQWFFLELLLVCVCVCPPPPKKGPHLI